MDPEPRRISPKEQQQEFYDYFGYIDRVTWDFYDLNNDKHALERKVGFALFGPPTNLPNSEISSSKQEIHHTGYESKQVALIEKISKKIINENCFSLIPNELHMSILFVLCVQDLQGNVPEASVQNRVDVKYEPYAVFRIRKCVKDDDGRSRCFIFVDHEGRTYQSWNNYLKNNNLPRGKLVVPENGIYNATIEEQTEKVKLTELPSPACSIKRKLLRYGDMAGLVTSVSATCVGIAVAIPAIPVAAGVATAAAAAGAVSGGYSVVRSSINLADRSEHNQSINMFKDEEARNDWLGVAGGTCSIVAGGATKLLGNLVARGVDIGQSGKHVINVLNGASVVMNGVSVAHGVYQIFDICYNENETPSPLLLFQVSSSIFFFTHSVVNMRTADTIIREKQNEVLDEYRRGLRSNRHRKMFNKMEKETIRLAGNEVDGKRDIIRSINNIQNKNDFFAGAVRINKGLNSNNVKISFSADGNAVLNNVEIVDPMNFWAKSQSEHLSTYSRLPPPPSGSVSKMRLDNTIKSVKSTIAHAIANETIIFEGMKLLKAVQDNDTEYLIQRLSFYICPLQSSIQEMFMNFFFSFMSNAEEMLSMKLQEFLPNFADHFCYLFNFFYTYVSNAVYNILREQTSKSNSFLSEMENVVKSFYGVNNQYHMNNLIQNLFDYVSETLETRNKLINSKKRIYCTLCTGYFYE